MYVYWLAVNCRPCSVMPRIGSQRDDVMLKISCTAVTHTMDAHVHTLRLVMTTWSGGVPVLL